MSEGRKNCFITETTVQGIKIVRVTILSQAMEE